MTTLYQDILNLPHWEPKWHTRMPQMARAAQFAPFAALAGYEEAINKTAIKHVESFRTLDNEKAITYC